MEGFKPTFIPPPQLPNIRYRLKDIDLGTILADDRDPRIPLCRKPVVPIKEDEITRDTKPSPWHWSSDKHVSWTAKIWAKISGLPVGGGLSGERAADHSILIDSKAVKTHFFSPDIDYLKNLTANPVVKGYTSDPDRPWVHLVISIMVAESATFEITKGKKKVFKVELQGDGSAAAVPASGGAEAGASKEESSQLKAEAAEPFILAYQLLKVRPKEDDTPERQYDNKPALFDDTNPEAHDLMDEWEIEETTAQEIWEDI